MGHEMHPSKDGGIFKYQEHFVGSKEVEGIINIIRFPAFHAKLFSKQVSALQYFTENTFITFFIKLD